MNYDEYDPLNPYHDTLGGVLVPNDSELIKSIRIMAEEIRRNLSRYDKEKKDGVQ